MAAAMKSAADAAVDGAKARAAAARANQADAQAQADAKLAREAANQAYADAAAARQAANQAEAEAARARGAAAEADQHAAAANSAASLAESEAATAQAAATQAAKDAEDAGKLAESAESHAKSAKEAANNALKYAKQADEVAKQAEKEQEERDRKAREEAANAGKVSGRQLTDKDARALEDIGMTREEYEKYQKLAGMNFTDFLKEIGGELLIEYFDGENIQKCYSEGNVEACFWALVNNLPWGKALRAIEKFPEIVKAIKRLVGLEKLLDESAKAKKIIKETEELLEEVNKKVPACAIKPKPKTRAAFRNSVVVATPALMTTGARKAVSGIRGGQLMMASTGNEAQDLGISREEYIAKLIGGHVAKDAKGQDIPIHMPNVGKSGLDVIGPDGEFVFVGGGAKAKDPAKFGKLLKISKWAADEAGVKAVYYLADNTPESAIKQAKKTFGEENVHIFTLPTTC